MKKSLLILSFSLLAYSFAVAQSTEGDEARSGSVYSGFGVGAPADIGNAEVKAMGIPGVSFNYLFTPGINNPAFWSRGRFSRSTAGFNVSTYEASQGGASTQNTIFEAGYIHLVFPLLPNKLGISAALYPYTRQNYRVFSSETINENTSDPISYAVNNQGFGGVNKLEFGLAWSPFKNFSIGYAPSLVFLTNTSSRLFVFAPATRLEPATVDNRINGYSMGHRFGALYTWEAILNEEDFLQFGATFTPSVNIGVDETQETQKDISSNATVIVDLLGGQNSTGDLTLPTELALGATYFASPLVNISVEGQLQQWSQYQNELNTSSEQFLKDRFKIGTGFQYHPYKTNASGFLTNFKYSAGVSYDTGHLEIDGENIKTLWLSGGLGLFSPRTFSSFDISVQYGLRGQNKNNIIQENILAISLSVNLTELFFNRPKLN